ncbi:Molybdopterin synthase sulfur carrier subunit [Cyberlindnera fabianii]|uniref:Molybdopterin synthase sulfur carrier subunit n=1 Tax=Cyberlindnera fabianii TaxID=36022 RepID=A0A1V2L3W2_CYBFA|nr:Molybdopterin synthase sulfur carrier subunit [Cyberlindnera fabianii]
MVSVRYYGPSADFTTKTEEKLTSIKTISALVQHFETEYSVNFADYVRNNCGICVNLEYIDLNEDSEMTLSEEDEVAIIPPVSSG